MAYERQIYFFVISATLLLTVQARGNVNAFITTRPFCTTLKTTNFRFSAMILLTYVTKKCKAFRGKSCKLTPVDN